MRIETARLLITEFTMDMAQAVHLNSLDEDNRRFVPDEVFETVEAAAELVVKSGLVEKAPVAQIAIPKCNITCITGEEMKEMLSDYLKILEKQDASFIGGAVPDDDFYVVIRNE